MPLDVALGGIAWPWLLRCDRELEAWARSLPWLREGATISLASGARLDECLGLIRRSVFQWDAGRSDVRVVDVEWVGDVFSSMTRWLGITARDRRALARTLGEDLAIRPCVFVVTLETGAARLANDQAEELRELVTKLDSQRGPTFAIVQPTGAASVLGVLRADRGWPVGLADTVLQSEQRDAWRQYLHLRIAWETDGHIDTAIACSSQFPNLQVGDDDGCEDSLNRFAAATFTALPREEQRAWRTAYERAVQRRAGRPPDGAPWIARALLLNRVPMSLKRALRAELICRPLVERLLNTCFALEANLRMRVGDGSGECDDRKAHEVLARYLDPHSRCFERGLYPRQHPAPPEDVWDFVSLGSLMKTIGEDVPELVAVRNSLSHGHYANWEAVSLLRRSLARLCPS